ncbi:LysR family transcriptional regulator [Sinomonas sp. ASV322]|uniref:LysR family transcriptional regulator n=1 Tax=Sinomonas sp. ASV322 TaxID=3041920 RepID=UPI0027DC2331|nr:LysR family transcriptional regulator [Sinomonas sp. ASV322]MDQ4502470.1 LysR family transcriptional regulator [Sinomonas sp. ASV322]
MAPTVPQLRTLLAVVDSGSFTSAAQLLGVSQSSVSRTLRALEEDIGGILLDRERANAPTVLAGEVIPHARAAVAALDALDGSMRARSGVPEGRVRLGAVPTVCQGLVPGLLTVWAARLPKVEVSLFEGDDDEIPEWLENGTVDAAILVDPHPDPPGSVVVGADEYCAVVRRDHPLAGEERIPLRELHEDGLIVNTGGCENEVRRIHAKAGMPFEMRQRVRELATLIVMVQEGVGVAIMPGLGAAMLPDELQMVPLEPTLGRRLVLSGPANRAWNPLAEALVGALRAR